MTVQQKLREDQERKKTESVWITKELKCEIKKRRHISMMIRKTEPSLVSILESYYWREK